MTVAASVWGREEGPDARIAAIRDPAPVLERAERVLDPLRALVLSVAGSSRSNSSPAGKGPRCAGNTAERALRTQGRVQRSRVMASKPIPSISTPTSAGVVPTQCTSVMEPVRMI